VFLIHFIIWKKEMSTEVLIKFVKVFPILHDMRQPIKTTKKIKYGMGFISWINFLLFASCNKEVLASRKCSLIVIT
jgi:hypothetical protein